MTKQKSTKRALLGSALAVLLCVSMLIGSTFAWFTDSVTSAGNKIQAGTLDVQLLMDLGDANGYTDISDSVKPIFGADSLLNEQEWWEPGKTEVAYLAIKNNGNLALKYKVALNVTDVTKEMYKVMEYAIVPDAKKGDVTDWDDGLTVVEGLQPVSGDVSLAAGATHYFALAIHMNEDAGNTYQGGSISFDMTVLATQDTVEADSFGTDYDALADYDGEISSPDALQAAFAAGGTYKLVSDIALPAGETLEIPAGAAVVLELGDNKITAETSKDTGAVLANKGTLTIKNGALSNSTVNGAAVIENTGELTLEGVLVEGAPIGSSSYPEYAITTYGKLTIEEGTTVHSDRGAIRTYDGDLVINGGEFVVSDAADGRNMTIHTIYAYGSGSTVTINGGSFEQNHTSTGGASVICPAGAAVTIYGGDFRDAMDDNTWTSTGNFQNYMGYSAPVKVYGGTYDDKTVSKHIAEGYTALSQEDGTYSVVAAIVYNADTMGGLYDLLPTLSAGDVLVLPAGTYNTSGTFTVAAGVTIKGQDGKTVVIHQNSSAQDNIFNCAGDATFQNIVFETNRKGYAVTDNTKDHNTDGDITIIDCKFKGLAADKNWGVYKNLNGNLLIKNCTFDNYNNAICGVSNGGDSTTVVTGCTFSNIDNEAIGYIASSVPADFESEVIANNTGLTADNVIGY